MSSIAYRLGFLSILLVLANPAAGRGDGDTAFEKVVHRYETARLSLINDTTDGVSDRAQEIVVLLDALVADFSAQKAGIDAAHSEDVRSLLPLLRKAAVALAEASDLTDARDAFYELSKPLVRWRKVAVVELPALAYCPMAKRSWLQPKGELGNPYYGQSMLTCGETIES